MIAFFLILAPQSADPVLTLGSREDVQVRGATLDRAMSEFRALCLAKPFDRSVFDKAAAASGWKFEQSRTGPAYADHWRSIYADATFNSDGPVPRGLAVPQCNFLAASAKKVGSSGILAAINAVLADAGATGIKFERVGERLVWSWNMQGGVAQLNLIDPDPEGQVVNLSLQFWTPDWIARAPALLEQAKRASGHPPESPRKPK